MTVRLNRRSFFRGAKCCLLIAGLCVHCWPQDSTMPQVCQLSGHCFGIIHELAEPVVVRSAEGDVRISSTLPDDPLRGAVVEIFGPNGSSRKHVAETDERGRFNVNHLATGTYSFHIGRSGFNSVVGRLIISKKAGRKNKLHFEMTFGV